MPKVFISYSHKDEAWKERLQTQLAVLETQGLLSVWEDRQIAAGDGWYPEIERSIKSAHVAILLISADFLSSKFIQGKEIPPLLERRKQDGLRVIPLILKPCPWPTVPWLSKIQGRPLDNQPLSGFDEHNQDHHLSELALEINELLKSISPSTKPDSPEKPTAPSSSTLATYDPHNAAFLVPFRAKGQYMVGRDKALKIVRQQLLAGKPTNIGQTALFQGIGGLGKTQLAVEYAYHYRSEYPNGVYWITADENIDAQLTQIAVAARWVAPESEHAIKLDVARHRLKSYSDCLIVFDNLESVDTIRDYLPEPSANPHILVTSRSEQTMFTDVKLELLNDAQSLVMLLQEAKTQPKNQEEESASSEIVAALGGLPLALELAGAYLAHRPIGWCAYRNLLRKNLKQALPTQLASLTRHEADLFKTLAVSEQDIDEEPLLGEVLDLLTWSSSSPMSLRLMAHLLDVQPTQLYGALGLGVALRLLQQVPDSERYAIHRLVQEVRRQDRPLVQRNDWANEIMQRLGDWFEAIRKDFRELPVFELEFDHLRAWQVLAERSSPFTSARLLWLQAYPAHHRGRYDEALRIVQKALAIYGTQSSGHTLLKANLLNDHSSCSASLGDYRSALELGKQALNMRRKLLGDKHPDVAFSLCNLASSHAGLDNHSLALELGQQALEMQRELLGDKHDDVARSLANLSSVRANLGDYASALEIGEQALDMQRELWGNKHPNVARSLSHLANYHAKLGDYPRALELGQQALEMRRELLGDKHPSVASSLGNLASFYSKLGKYTLALELGQQAFEMRRELLGASHPATIDSLRFVAKRLYGNPSTAGRGKALVEEFLRHIPRDHPSHAKVLSIGSPKGFRPPGKPGHSKKHKKK
jgi:tetratricopeptide (TPR) repeat protein